jgi:hypothetical protein
MTIAAAAIMRIERCMSVLLSARRGRVRISQRRIAQPEVIRQDEERTKCRRNADEPPISAIL